MSISVEGIEQIMAAMLLSKLDRTYAGWRSNSSGVAFSRMTWTERFTLIANAFENIESQLRREEAKNNIALKALAEVDFNGGLVSALYKDTVAKNEALQKQVEELRGKLAFVRETESNEISILKEENKDLQMQLTWMVDKEQIQITALKEENTMLQTKLGIANAKYADLSKRMERVISGIHQV